MAPVNHRHPESGHFYSCIPRMFLAVLLVVLTSALTQAQDGWNRQPAGTMAWLHGIYFLDKNRGWAVGSKGTFLTTIDGGISWQPKTAPSPDVLRDIFFTTEQDGWLVCEKNIYDLKENAEPRTYLMQTSDGGEHWTRVSINGVDADTRLVRAVFSRGGRGWIFGEAGAIFATRDGGVNWTRLISPTRHLLLGGNFIDEYRGWLVGAGATIIQTADGGDTWHVARLPQAIERAVRFTATSFVDNRLGWAVGSEGSVYRTVNGGRTWQMQNSQVSADLYDVKFINGLEGWAVGAEGTIIHTADGGVRWTEQRSNTVHPLERVFFLDETRGWAVGFGGTVVAYVRNTPLKVRQRTVTTNQTP